MGIRKLVLIATLLFASAQAAHAEAGFGVIIGRPTGLDVKVDLSHRSALDLVGGVYSRWHHYGDGAYVHLSWLYQPVVAVSGGVAIPLRIGIGGAVYDDSGRFDNNDTNLALRVPFEVGFRFLHTPFEIYVELALKVIVVDPDHDQPDANIDAGVGFRIMF